VFVVVAAPPPPPPTAAAAAAAAKLLVGRCGVGVEEEERETECVGLLVDVGRERVGVEVRVVSGGVRETVGVKVVLMVLEVRGEELFVVSPSAREAVTEGEEEGEGVPPPPPPAPGTWNHPPPAIFPPLVSVKEGEPVEDMDTRRDTEMEGECVGVFD